MIGSAVENSLSSIRQGGRSALLPEQISSSFDNEGSSRLVSCCKSSCTSLPATWAAIKSWANSFLFLFHFFFFVFTRVWDEIVFPNKNIDSLFFLIAASISFELVTNPSFMNWLSCSLAMLWISLMDFKIGV